MSVTKDRTEGQKLLKAWIHWKKLELKRNPDEDDEAFVWTIEDLIAECDQWKIAYSEMFNNFEYILERIHQEARIYPDFKGNWVIEHEFKSKEDTCVYCEMYLKAKRIIEEGK